MNTNWKKWAVAALIRAVRTFAEAMIAYIGTGAVVLGDVNWLAALSAGAFGFVLAILLALTGLPEVEQDEGENLICAGGAGKPPCFLKQGFFSFLANIQMWMKSVFRLTLNFPIQGDEHDDHSESVL